MGLGTLRFILAAFVAYSHFAGHSLRYNFGIIAVVGFYFISGYLMRVSFEKFTGFRNPAFRFYIDRFWRIFPAFLLVAFVTIFLSFLNITSPTLYSSLTLRSLIMELLIIPQNFLVVSEYFSGSIIPPAWSVGTELQWYILVPFVFLLPKAARWLVFLSLLFGRFMALNPTLSTYGGTLCDYLSGASFKCMRMTDLLGYRLIFFVGAVFRLGDMIGVYRRNQNVQHLIMLCVVTIYSLIFFISAPSTGDINSPYVAEVSLGMMIIVPFALLSFDHAYSKPDNYIDRLIGRMAYPVFLTHILATQLVDAYSLDFIRGNRLAEFTLVTILLAAIVAAFQHYIDKKRYESRGFS